MHGCLEQALRPMQQNVYKISRIFDMDVCPANGRILPETAPKQFARCAMFKRATGLLFVGIFMNGHDPFMFKFAPRPGLP